MWPNKHFLIYLTLAIVINNYNKLYYVVFFLGKVTEKSVSKINNIYFIIAQVKFIIYNILIAIYVSSCFNLQCEFMRFVI